MRPVVTACPWADETMALLAVHPAAGRPNCTAPAGVAAAWLFVRVAAAVLRAQSQDRPSPAVAPAAAGTATGPSAPHRRPAQWWCWHQGEVQHLHRPMQRCSHLLPLRQLLRLLQHHASCLQPPMLVAVIGSRHTRVLLMLAAAAACVFVSCVYDCCCCCCCYICCCGWCGCCLASGARVHQVVAVLRRQLPGPAGTAAWPAAGCPAGVPAAHCGDQALLCGWHAAAAAAAAHIEAPSAAAV